MTVERDVYTEQDDSPWCDCDCGCEKPVEDWGDVCAECDKNCEDPDAGDPTTKPWYIEPGYEPFAADD